MTEISPRRNLFGATRQELERIFEEMGERPFRARQLQDWIFRKRVVDFERMTNLPRALRDRLAERFVVAPPVPAEKRVSRDGSVKYVFPAGEGQQVEAVYMPMESGVTLCLSSQVGCAQACSFCLTAQMGFIRNLTAGEIVGQAYAIMLDQGFEPPFNVVMMGMGEPLLNLRNLTAALDIFFDDLGFALPQRRVTVSTSGHVRNLLRLGEYPKLPRIAVSLNASNDSQRNQLMPVNFKWGVQELIEACKQLPIPKRERITFEYVLIRGVNDSEADARRLARLVSHVRCKVNLIPFNETEGLPYRQPDLPAIERFRDILNRSRILNMVRWSKGRDVGAACGQLATPVVRRGPDLGRSRSAGFQPTS